MPAKYATPFPFMSAYYRWVMAEVDRNGRIRGEVFAVGGDGAGK